MHHYNSVVIFSIAFFALLSRSHGQESVHLLENNLYFPDGIEYYQEELFGIAIHQVEREVFTDEFIDYQSKNSFELNESRSIDLLLESVNRGGSIQEKNKTYFIIADKYFRNKDYATAKKYFKNVNKNYLIKSEQQEQLFKLGYIAIKKQQFGEAENYFSESGKLSGNYNAESNYYLGIAQYYLNKRDAAIASFEKVQNHRKYKDLIPFYLAQIFFKEGDYDQVIAYTEKRKSAGADQAQIDRMLGLSYLAKGDNLKALTYLEAYEKASPKLTENEFFQIAMTNYNLGNKSKAEKYFKELSHQSSKIGQISNYILGSLLINKDAKKDAQSAFKQSAKLDYYPKIKNESSFLYYKLSAQLGEERIAINGLSAVANESPYYNEAQSLLADLLVRSKDYKAAINIADNLPYKSPEVLKAYKALHYKNGLQNLEDGNTKLAIASFKISNEIEGTRNEESDYYLGYAYDKNGDNALATDYLQKYIASGDTEHQFEAKYILAYQKISAQDYDGSLSSLESAINSFDIDSDDKTLFDDALVRLADLELVNNNYEDAIAYYDMAVQNNAEESDYILYQKALIYGVNGQQYDKLTNLESLIKNYPNSKYRDDALFEIGESLVALNKNNEAVKVYRTIIIEYGNKSPYTALSYMRQGLISYNQGDLQASLDSYKQGLRLTQNKDEKRQALLAIEEIYLNELNDPDSWFTFTEDQGGIKIADIEKDSITFSIALKNYKKGLYEKSISQFESYLGKYQNGHYKNQAEYFIGESYVVLKNYNRALTYYDRVTQDKSSTHYYSALKKAALIAYNHKQDFEKSLAYYKLLVEKDLSLENTEAGLFSAYKTNDDNAIQKFGQLVTNNAAASNESKSNAHFYLGKSFMRQNKTDDAIKEFNAVVRLSSNNHAAEASYNVAAIFLQTGMKDKAETQAFETTKRAASYPFWVAKSLILLGDIYELKEDYLNATAAFESVIENFTENEELRSESQSKLDNLNIKIKEASRVIDEEDLETIESDSIR